MFCYADMPLDWYRRFCVTASKLSQECHMGFRAALRALAAEPDIRVYVYATRGRSCYYFVREELGELFKAKHGTTEARAARRRHIPVKPKGIPLQSTCRRCGKRGRQWRQGFNTSGRTKVKCGHCKYNYAIGEREPIGTTCPRCGATERQQRYRKVPGGRRVTCKPCGRTYTVRPDPDVVREKMLMEFGNVPRRVPMQW